MTDDYMRDWARRAIEDLRDYARAASDAGCQQQRTDALIVEGEDILAGRPLWKHQAGQAPADRTLLDEL